MGHSLTYTVYTAVVILQQTVGTSCIYIVFNFSSWQRLLLPYWHVYLLGNLGIAETKPNAIYRAPPPTGKMKKITCFLKHPTPAACGPLFFIASIWCQFFLLRHVFGKFRKTNKPRCLFRHVLDTTARIGKNRGLLGYSGTRERRIPAPFAKCIIRRSVLSCG